jgi:predicted GNAT family acetyltransferase
MSDEVIRHDPAARCFEMKLGGESAVLNYELEGRRMTITHTHVPPKGRGRGVAAALVKEALGHAEAEGWRVVPQCSYVDAFMRRHPEYAVLRAG